MNGIIPNLYYDRKVKTRRYNDYLRDILDPFDISDRCFIDNYRMPKALVMQLIEDIKPFMEDTENVLSVPLHLEVLATLNFYASGSHQRRVGLDAFARMSQSKISNSITRISEVIGLKLSSEKIVFPETLAEASIKKDEFFDKYGVPGIVGLIDCTHIAVANIRKKDEYAFVNRKNFHSINTQAICDLNMRILSINARFPGSTHDSYIWGGSTIVPVLERLNQEDNHTWLFGDSGYALSKLMMVPYRRPITEAEHQYNKVHCKIRSGIERCFGLLKSRFRCLKSTSGHLHYTHKKASNIIYACAVLHNTLIDNNYPIEDIDDEIPDEIVPGYNAEEEGNSGEDNRRYLKDFVMERGVNI